MNIGIVDFLCCLFFDSGQFRQLFRAFLDYFEGIGTKCFDDFLCRYGSDPRYVSAGQQFIYRICAARLIVNLGAFDLDILCSPPCILFPVSLIGNISILNRVRNNAFEDNALTVFYPRCNKNRKAALRVTEWNINDFCLEFCRTLYCISVICYCLIAANHLILLNTTRNDNPDTLI